MLGFTIMMLVSKLRVAIIRRIIIAEECRPRNTIKLYEITLNMGTNSICFDATTYELLFFLLQLCFVCNKLHIVF